MANINIWKTDVNFNPIPITIDSVYGIDVDVNYSSIGSFTGDLLSLFNNYQTEIVDNSATSPKWFEVCFKRPICSDKIVLCSKTNNFSNVKITFLGASNSEISVIDDSANDEKYHCKSYEYVPVTFIKLKVEFFTTDGVSIAGLCLNKTLHIISSIHGLDNKTSLITPVKTTDGNLLIEGIVRVKNPSNQTIYPATEEKQEIIIGKLNIGDYMSNDIDDTEPNIMYVGKEKIKSGDWLILKLDMVNGISIRYASHLNNNNYTTYTDAWADRTILTYSYLREVL